MYYARLYIPHSFDIQVSQVPAKLAGTYTLIKVKQITVMYFIMSKLNNLFGLFEATSLTGKCPKK